MVSGYNNEIVPMDHDLHLPGAVDKMAWRRVAPFEPRLDQNLSVMLCPPFSGVQGSVHSAEELSAHVGVLGFRILGGELDEDRANGMGIKMGPGNIGEGNTHRVVLMWWYGLMLLMLAGNGKQGAEGFQGRGG